MPHHTAQSTHKWKFIIHNHVFMLPCDEERHEVVRRQQPQEREHAHCTGMKRTSQRDFSHHFCFFSLLLVSISRLVDANTHIYVKCVCVCARRTQWIFLALEQHECFSHKNYRKYPRAFDTEPSILMASRQEHGKWKQGDEEYDFALTRWERERTRNETTSSLPLQMFLNWIESLKRQRTNDEM